MKFETEHEADAWIQFMTGALASGWFQWEDVVARADNALAAYRERRTKTPPGNPYRKGYP